MKIPRSDAGMSIDDLAALITSDQMIDLHYGDIVTRVYKPDLADARRDVNVQAMSRSYRRAYMAVVEKSLRGFVPKVRLWAMNPETVVKAEADNLYHDMLIFAALRIAHERGHQPGITAFQENYTEGLQDYVRK